MKKFYVILFLSTCIMLTLNAQPTLTYNNNAPEIGDIYYMNFVDITDIGPGASGQNINWDFSSCPLISSMNQSVVDPATTPYGNDFPEANTAFVPEESQMYSYALINSTGFDMYGYVFDAGGIFHYSDPAKRMKYPFSYNNTYIDNYYCVGTVQTMTSRICGTSTVTADAYGNLITPDGTFNNVLRVKIYDEYTDSMFMDQTFITVSNCTQTNYTWYSADSKAALFNYSINVVDEIIDTNAYYSSESASIDEIDKNAFANLQIFPNPATDIININYELKNKSSINIKILNQTGQEIFVINTNEKSAGIQNEKININDLPPGIYYLRLGNNYGKSICKKLIIR
ncbi:MAG: T9SS type A sorting domain-containing protein [Bacteroidales bacterium]|nr:T9SS type A sorting domain-containing protein [Bacteroidales bacterium]